MKSIVYTVFMAFIALSFSANSSAQSSRNYEKPTLSLMVWDEIAKEGFGAAEFRLFITGDVEEDFTVYYEISGSAKNGYDFLLGQWGHDFSRNAIVISKESISGLEPGSGGRMETSTLALQYPLIIKPVNDKIMEGDESVTITLLENPGYNIDPENISKTVIIQDDEFPDVQFKLPSSKGLESSNCDIEVTLSKPYSQDVSIDYSVTGILAERGSDYNLLDGNMVIPAGRTSANLSVSIINDEVAEDDETIVFEITKASNANIGLNEKHYYEVVNDDGDVQRTSIYDKIYGLMLGSRGGSSIGGVVEFMGTEDAIENIYGGLFHEFIAYRVNDVWWSNPAGATEDGIERQKAIATAIIEKQDRIKSDDILKIWSRDHEMEELYFLCMPYDRVLSAYAKWGFDEMVERFGLPTDLGPGIHLTARVFHPIPAINACDPEGAIVDTKEIGQLYYEDKENDPAYAWGGVYNAAVALAMMPDATVNSVIEGALGYATPEIRKEIEYGLAIADKYTDPLDRGFRDEINAMYHDPSSPYYVNPRMQSRYVQSSVYENVTISFAILKLTQGNVEQAIKIADNRGWDTDCTAASAGGLAGALTGTKTISKEFMDALDQGMVDNAYTISHISDKATAQYIYRALQNKLRRMEEEVKVAEDKYGKRRLPAEDNEKKEYVELMKKLEVI